MGNNTLPEVAKTANELYLLASKCGILGALKVGFGGNVSVSVKVPKSLTEMPIDEFDFETRVNGILSKWCDHNKDKPRTVQRIVDLVQMGDHAREFVRGYGHTTRSRLQSFLLNECYERMTEAEQREFCVNAIIQNCRFEEFV